MQGTGHAMEWKNFGVENAQNGMEDLKNRMEDLLPYLPDSELHVIKLIINHELA